MGRKQDEWNEIGQWAYATKTAQGNGEPLKNAVTNIN